MSSRKRSHRHSFYVTPHAVETRKEERYNQLRQRRLSAFAEIAEASTTREANNSLTQCTTGGFDIFQRQRSNSLPCPTTLNNMIIKMDEDASKLCRPHSVSFDPTAKLYIAAAENDVNELKRVLDSGKAKPNILYLSGVAPLHIAAADGNLESIKLLVQYGADINILDQEGCSPLEFALRGAHFDCASFLITSGAEIGKIVDGLH